MRYAKADKNGKAHALLGNLSNRTVCGLWWTRRWAASLEHWNTGPRCKTCERILAKETE